MSDDSATPDLPEARPYRAPRRLRWLTLLVILPCGGAVLGFAIGLISAFVAPKKYESDAVVQIHGPTHALGLSGDRFTSQAAAAQPDRFLETQLEVIEAPETLSRVADRLNLSKRWHGMDPDTVLKVLGAIVKVEPIDGTELARIRVRHFSAQDARDVAAEVPRAYLQRREADERQRANETLNALDGEIRNQEDLVEEKRKLFLTIVKAVGIPYIEGLQGSGVMGRKEEELLRAAVREQAKLEAEKRSMEVEHKTLLRLNADELLKYVVQEDRAPELKKRWQKFNALRTELELERVKLGEEDLKVQALQKAVALHEKDLQEAVTAYQEKLQIDLNLMDYRLQIMKEIAEERRFDAVDKSLQAQDYVEAKQDYEAAKDMLQEMKLRHSTQRIALKLPMNIVTIHEWPVIAKFPASPNMNRMMLMGILLGGGIGLLLALPISALMIAKGS